MHITLADIEGMASPGWECGSDIEVLGEDLEGFGEVLEGDEDYAEIDFSDAARGEPEPELEPEDETAKPVRYADGQREGSTTFEICTRLKNERMTGKNLMEQEFAAIRRTYPKDGSDLKILMWLASGFSYQQTGKLLERSEKTVRNAARRLRQFRDHGTVKFLPAHLVQVGEDLWKPFPPTRAGRPRGGKNKLPTEITPREITAELSVVLDLFGDPVRPRPPRKPRKPGVRRLRVRAPVPGQLTLFDMAA